MKHSKILYIVLLLLLLLPVFAGCSEPVEIEPVNYYTSENNLEEYTLENDFLRLHMDGATSYFSLEDKTTGEIWYSVPENGATDPMADATMRKWLQSTMILTYSINSGLTTIFDNYTNSISGGTFQITQEGDSIRVDYMIGEAIRVFIVPEIVTQARFEELIAPMTKSEQSTIKSVYRKLDPAKLPSDEDPEELMNQYPLLAEGVIYVKRDGVADYRYEQAEEYFEKYGYTREDYENDQLQTEDDESLLQFNASVVYTLEGDSLSVVVPGDSLRCSLDYQMTSLQLLPYFGAGSTEDDGFLLIPDGGGAIINFNDRNGTSSGVASKVYGWDMAKNKSQMISENAVSFPVFGIQKNGSYLLAVTDSCAGELTIDANVSGNRNGYNSVSPTFEIVHGDLMYVSSKSDIQVMVYEKVRQYEDISINYISGDGDSYVDMAHTYRDYFMSKHPELKMKQDAQLPFAVELIGALDHIKQIVGVPMQVVLPATSYQEAADIVQQLQQMQLGNLNIKYNAVMNGGRKQTSLQSAKLVSELGTATQLKNLVQLIEDNGDSLYLAGYGSHVFDTKTFDTFNIDTDTICNTLSEVVEAKRYDIITHQQDKKSIYYILNADACGAAVENMSSMAQKYGFDGIAFDDLGNHVTSDFSADHATSRTAMAQLHAKLLQQAKANGQKVMINGGNDYAAAYADMILNMDLSGSNYDLVDKQVPFYQIALHGLVDYTGQAVNMADNYQYNILKSIETGAGLYFLFAEIPASELQMTSYTMYSSARFDEWKETIEQLAGTFRDELGHTYGQMITDHQYLTEKVTVTVYEDGTRVYVNYSDADVTLEDGTVEAMNYLVVGGKN